MSTVAQMLIINREYSREDYKQSLSIIKEKIGFLLRIKVFFEKNGFGEW